MLSPGDATYGHAIPASFERYFYLMTWAAMHLEHCSRDLDMDEINPYWCLQWEHQILLEEKSINISLSNYHVASITQPGRLFEVLAMVLAKIRYLYGIPLIGYVRNEPFVLTNDDHREYYNCPDAEMEAWIMIYNKEDLKTDKVAMKDDQIVIYPSCHIDPVGNRCYALSLEGAVPLLWKYPIMGARPLH